MWFFCGAFAAVLQPTSSEPFATHSFITSMVLPGLKFPMKFLQTSLAFQIQFTPWSEHPTESILSNFARGSVCTTTLPKLASVKASFLLFNILFLLPQQFSQQQLHEVSLTIWVFLLGVNSTTLSFASELVLYDKSFCFRESRQHPQLKS